MEINEGRKMCLSSRQSDAATTVKKELDLFKTHEGKSSYTAPAEGNGRLVAHFYLNDL